MKPAGRPLRVLIPYFAGVDTFQDNVAHTLRKMGHTVETPGYKFRRQRGRVNRIVSDTIAAVFPQRWEEHENYALSAARAFRPDLILCLTQTLRSETLASLHDLGACLVAWWGDPPANMRGMGLLAEGWDAIFIKDEMAVKKMRAVGLNAQLMHEAFNPDWHCPQGAPKDDTVAVVGNYYGYRQFLVSRLLDAGVELALHGFPPPRWGDRRIHQKFSGRYITRSEKSAVFEGALASLNCTTMSEGDSLNCRAFEICGAAGLQLIEDKPSVEACFEPGREVLAYRSVDEIVDHLARARIDREWAKRIREEGHRRAHAAHTYKHRLEQILKAVDMA